MSTSWMRELVAQYFSFTTRVVCLCLESGLVGADCGAIGGKCGDRGSDIRSEPVRGVGGGADVGARAGQSDIGGGWRHSDAGHLERAAFGIDGDEGVGGEQGKAR